ncbi:uncharacterized protein [Oscarella lobularis]|uniref:uncharacterized protein n=1 Tax=Oscarella lobularis TaxID=121494 RepID=UPI003313FA07
MEDARSVLSSYKGTAFESIAGPRFSIPLDSIIQLQPVAYPTGRLCGDSLHQVSGKGIHDDKNSRWWVAPSPGANVVIGLFNCLTTEYLELKNGELKTVDSINDDVWFRAESDFSRTNGIRLKSEYKPFSYVSINDKGLPDKDDSSQKDFDPLYSIFTWSLYLESNTTYHSGNITVISQSLCYNLAILKHTTTLLKCKGRDDDVKDDIFIHEKKSGLYAFESLAFPGQFLTVRGEKIFAGPETAHSYFRLFTVPHESVSASKFESYAVMSNEHKFDFLAVVDSKRRGAELILTHDPVNCGGKWLFRKEKK